MPTINNSSRSEFKDLHKLSRTELFVAQQYLKTKKELLENEESAKRTGSILIQTRIGMIVYGFGLLFMVMSITWIGGILLGNVFTAFMLLGMVLLIAGFYTLTSYPNKLTKKLHNYYLFIQKASYERNR